MKYYSFYTDYKQRDISFRLEAPAVINNGQKLYSSVEQQVVLDSSIVKRNIGVSRLFAIKHIHLQCFLKFRFVESASLTETRY